jgi:NADPH-dependent 2,4-dienoyl-CoA reductase/sulfur reductase-like enzyme
MNSRARWPAVVNERPVTEHIVVVGASLAGLRTVQGLRRRHSRARITLIGEEPELPYDRPPLSKSVLLGTADAESVRFLDDASIASLDVDLRLGVAARRLSLGGRHVELVDSSRVEFDRMVIATGSSPRLLPGVRALAGVHVLRTIGDAVRIRAGLLGASRVAVVGGGFIGAELASAACQLGREVSVIDSLPTMMTRGLGLELGMRMTEVHRSRGVLLHLGSGVSELAGDGAVSGLRLTDGSLVPADLVVIGIGALPNDGWLIGSGLPVDDGVVCDEYLCAADGVYAVGDVARWHNPRYGELMRMEHWTSANEQAATLAATLTGTPTPCRLVPQVWSDQFGRRLQIFGRISQDADIDVVFEDGERFVALARQSGNLHGVAVFDALTQALPYRAQLIQAS